MQIVIHSPLAWVEWKQRWRAHLSTSPKDLDCNLAFPACTTILPNNPPNSSFLPRPHPVQRSPTKRCWTTGPTGRSSRRTSRSTPSSRGWAPWGPRWRPSPSCTTSTSTGAATWPCWSWPGSASTRTFASGSETSSPRRCTGARRVCFASCRISHSSAKDGSGCVNLLKCP